MSPRQVFGLSVLVTLAAGGLAAAQSEEDPTQLQPIIITPQINPLDESMERLRKMMEDAPCLGCDGVRKAARDAFEDAAQRALLVMPLDQSFEERQGFRIRNDWKLAERGQEWDAFRD